MRLNHILNQVKSYGLAVLVVGIAACAQHFAGPLKTQVLPADGGDLGKAWVEYVKAVQAGDKAQILKFSNPASAHADAYSFRTLPLSVKGQPMGGRQQGDRATLFLRMPASNAQHFDVSLQNATHTSSGWKFDGQLERVFAGYGSTPSYDCNKTAEFPCAISTAPDSIVSGTIVLHKYETELHKTAPVFVMFDGFGVRMFDEHGKTPKSTRVFLSSMGILPEMITHDNNNDVRSVRYTLADALLDLEVAPDGKSAHARYSNKGTVLEADINDGLTIESNDGKRIRGRLNTDIKDLAALNLYFDVSTASVCHAHSSDCRHD